VKYLLIYTSADDVAEKAPLHFAAHRARWAEFRANGTLLLIGPYADQSGALAVLTTREAAEEFARSDPFVLHGVVREWSVREWLGALGGP
jgi:uncharacterized protein YciI